MAGQARALGGLNHSFQRFQFYHGISPSSPGGECRSPAVACRAPQPCTVASLPPAVLLYCQTINASFLHVLWLRSDSFPMVLASEFAAQSAEHQQQRQSSAALQNVTAVTLHVLRNQASAATAGPNLFRKHVRVDGTRSCLYRRAEAGGSSEDLRAQVPASLG